MALEGITIGNGSTPAPSVPSTGSALKGFSIGNTTPAPTVNIPTAKVPDTSKLFAKTTSLISSSSTPSVAPKSDHEFNIAPTPDELKAQNASIGEAKPQSFWDKITGGVKNLFQGESPDQQYVNMSVQKSIVDKNLVDVGKKLGIDKQFPIDTTKDQPTAEFEQNKKISDYVRNNYNDIKSKLVDPTALPDHPEMLGPKYSEVSKNIDAYTKALGIRSNPTNTEIVGTLLSVPIAAGLIEAPIATVIGLAAFSAMSGVEHYLLGDTVAGKVADSFGLNNGTRDVLNLIELFAQGKALHTVYVKAPELATKWTKNIVETYMPGKTITFEPAQIRAALTGGADRGEITKGETEIINSVVGKGGATAWKDALKNGTSIEVAPEKVVSLVDKPYWAKIKSAFNVKSVPQEMSRTTFGETKVGPETRSNYLLGSGIDKLNEHSGVFQKEIKDAIDAHGEDVTRVELQTKLGIDPVEADKLISEAKAKEALTNPEKVSQKVMDKVAPKQTLGGISVHEASLEGVNPKQETRLSNDEATPLSEKASTRYWDEKIAPEMAAGKPTIIGGDDLKDHFGKDYNDNNHVVYSKASAQLYDRALKENKDPYVVLTGGGPASGKTELITKTLTNEGFKGVLYDSNLSNYEGAVKQIDQAKAAGKEVHIYGVLPNVDASRTFSLQREARTGRGISDKTFARGHAGFPAVIEKLLSEGKIEEGNVHLLDTRDVTSFEKAFDLIANNEFVKDPLALLTDLNYNEEEFNKIYAKENYNVTTGERQNPLPKRGSSSEAPSGDRANKENADGKGDESVLEKDTEIRLNSGFDPGVDKFLKEDVLPTTGALLQGFKNTMFGFAKVLVPTVGVKAVDLDQVMRMKGARDKQEYIFAKTHEIIKNTFSKMPQEKQVAFIDKMKRGEKQETEALQIVADNLRAIDTAMWKEAQKYKPSLQWKENHFRVMWKVVPGSPEAKGFSGLFTRPLQGTKGFAKQSTLIDMSEGLKMGGVPISYNPIELFTYAYSDMNKFITAQEMIQGFKNEGQMKFIKIGSFAPEGYTRLNDSIAKVYLPSEIQVKEFYDKQVMDGLNNVAKSLGITHERAVGGKGLTGNKMGVSFTGKDLVKTRFASPEAVLIHEIGHQIDDAYGMQQIFKGKDMAKELRALVDLKLGKDAVNPGKTTFQKYIRKGEEKMATIFEAYLHTPEEFARVAPNVLERFESFLNEHSELRPILDIKPGLQFTSNTASIDRGGPVQSGEWHIEENVGRLLNNYLSKDYIRSTDIGRGMLFVKNLYTAAELSFSPFHAVFESLETVGSSIGLGLQKIAGGQFKAGAKDILESPISPVTTAKLGGDAIKFMTLEGDKGDFFRQEYLKKNPQIGNLLTDLFNGGGRMKMDDAYQIETEKVFVQNIANGNYIGAALRVIPSLNKTLTKPLFEVYIPRLKIGTFLKEYSNDLVENAEDLASGKTTREELARKRWNFVEDRFGEMNFDNLFWNKTFKTSMQLMFRSVTWKLGNLRATGGALFGQGKEFYDAARQRRAPRMNPKMAWLLGMSVITAVIGYTIQKISTGKTPEGIKDIIYPQVDDKGNRISTPTYWKDAFHLEHDPVGYVQSSMSGMIGRITDVWQNKDFYGTEIFSPNDPFYTKAIDSMIHMAPVPFAVSSVLSLNQSGAPKDIQTLSFFGFTKAPGYINQTDTQQKIFSLFQKRLGGGTISQEDADVKNQKSDIRKAYQNGDTAKANELLNQAIKDGTIKDANSFITRADLPGDIRAFQALPASDQKDLIASMPPEDINKYGWYVKNDVKENFSSLSPAAKDFVDQVSKGEIKPPKYSKGVLEGDKPTYKSGEKTSSQSLISRVAAYAQAIGTDPVTAFKDIFKGQIIRRVDNGTIIVDRMSLQDSTAVKKAGGGNNPSMKLDHTVPLQLGGTNEESNLKLVPTDTWASYTPVENHLGEMLRAGKISKEEAQGYITDFKSGKKTADEILKM